MKKNIFRILNLLSGNGGSTFGAYRPSLTDPNCGVGPVGSDKPREYQYPMYYQAMAGKLLERINSASRTLAGGAECASSEESQRCLMVYRKYVYICKNR